jgi:hypothetical protein
MRTIKQLSIEKEVLQRYSEFIHQIFLLVSRILHKNKSSINLFFLQNVVETFSSICISIWFTLDTEYMRFGIPVLVGSYSY